MDQHIADNQNNINIGQILADNTKMLYRRTHCREKTIYRGSNQHYRKYLSLWDIMC